MARSHTAHLMQNSISLSAMLKCYADYKYWVSYQAKPLRKLSVASKNYDKIQQHVKWLDDWTATWTS